GPYRIARPPPAGVGHHHGLFALGAIAVAAVAATLDRRMYIHVLGSNACQFGRPAKQPLRILVSAPDIDSIVGHEDRRVARLHAGAWRERHRVHRLDYLGCPAHGFVDVALIGFRFTG